MVRESPLEEPASDFDNTPESRHARPYGMMVTALVIAATIAVVVDLVAT